MVQPEKLRLIGYWSSPGMKSSWPSVFDFIDNSWDSSERTLVAGHLSSGVIARSYMGYSPCRVCGIDNGALEFTDGYYVWPEGLEHYVRDHGVRLPGVFVRHVINIVDCVETVERDEMWWATASLH